MSCDNFCLCTIGKSVFYNKFYDEYKVKGTAFCSSFTSKADLENCITITIPKTIDYLALGFEGVLPVAYRNKNKTCPDHVLSVEKEQIKVFMSSAFYSYQDDTDYIIKNGELALKGLNRSTFEDILIKNIRRRIKPLGDFEYRKEQSTVAVVPMDDYVDMDEVNERISKVFGIAAYSRALQVEKDMEVILKETPEYLADQLREAKTFKVEGKRADKKFPLTSPELSAEVGGATLEKNANGALEFTTKGYGQEMALKIGFSSQQLAADLGFDTVELNDESGTWETELVTGKDAKVSLTTHSEAPEASEFSDTATVRTNGNKVMITDHAGFEMSFLIDEEFTIGMLDLEVTDIGTMTVHIGANTNQNMVISVPEVSSESLYIDDIDVTTMGGADAAISRLDEAIAKVSGARSTLGAYENRLDYSVASLDAFEENMTEAQSRLTDTDMAQEMTNYTQQNVLNQAAISVLSQANDMPQQVLQLLQ